MSKCQLNFTVRGDSGSKYQVTFIKEGNLLVGFCTCPAGEKGTYCKHRIRLLAGEISQLVSKNENDVHKLCELKTGTQLENILNTLFEREAQLDRLKKDIKAVKGELQKFMKAS